MYDFVFYFLYGILNKSNDDDSVFSAILGSFIIIGLHIISILKIFAYFGIIEGLPVFSNAYLINKLYWFIPLVMVLGIVNLYFGKEKTKAIISKYSSKENFYSFGNILLFLLLIIVPALLIAKL